MKEKIIVLFVIVFIVLLIADSVRDNHIACALASPTNVHVYNPGDKAIHVATQEIVRLIDKWAGGQSHDCKKMFYNVRFSDGAEIKAEWAELTPILK